VICVAAVVVTVWRRLANRRRTGAVTQAIRVPQQRARSRAEAGAR
jgi:hypothetical protein